MLTRAAALSISFFKGWSSALLATVAAIFLASGPCAAPAQGAPPPEGTGIVRVLSTHDDWQIYITFYPAPGDKENLLKEAPVIILLHGDKENRLVWEGQRGLAPHLQEVGYAVITVDLRKHGQSTNVRVAGDSPAGGKNVEGANIHSEDFRNMVEQDLEAVKHFIYEQHQAKRLNMNKLGIVGAESSAAVAACFAAADWNKEPYDDAPSDEMKTRRGQDVRAIVLLSPPQKVKGLSFQQALGELRNPEWNVALLTLYGKRNRNDEAAIKAYRKLFDKTKANDDRIYLWGYNVNLRGSDLLGHKEISAEATILKFFAKHLGHLRDSDWRDRQSRLLRK